MKEETVKDIIRHSFSYNGDDSEETRFNITVDNASHLLEENLIQALRDQKYEWDHIRAELKRIGFLKALKIVVGNELDNILFQAYNDALMNTDAEIEGGVPSLDIHIVSNRSYEFKNVIRFNVLEYQSSKFLCHASYDYISQLLTLYNDHDDELTCKRVAREEMEDIDGVCNEITVLYRRYFIEQKLEEK